MGPFFSEDYPFVAPARKPLIKAFWTKINPKRMGIVIIIIEERMYPHSYAVVPMKAAIPMGRVLRDSERMNNNASVYSFQTRTKVKIPQEMRPGRDKGRTI